MLWMNIISATDAWCPLSHTDTNTSLHFQDFLFSLNWYFVFGFRKRHLVYRCNKWVTVHYKCFKQNQWKMHSHRAPKYSRMCTEPGWTLTRSAISRKMCLIEIIKGLKQMNHILLEKLKKWTNYQCPEISEKNKLFELHKSRKCDRMKFHLT